MRVRWRKLGRDLLELPWAMFLMLTAIIWVPALIAWEVFRMEYTEDETNGRDSE